MPFSQQHHRVTTIIEVLGSKKSISSDEYVAKLPDKKTKKKLIANTLSISQRTRRLSGFSLPLRLCGKKRPKK